MSRSISLTGPRWIWSLPTIVTNSIPKTGHAYTPLFSAPPLNSRLVRASMHARRSPSSALLVETLSRRGFTRSSETHRSRSRMVGCQSSVRTQLVHRRTHRRADTARANTVKRHAIPRFARAWHASPLFASDALSRLLHRGAVNRANPRSLACPSGTGSSSAVRGCTS